MSDSNPVVTVVPEGLPEDDFVGPEFGMISKKRQFAVRCKRNTLNKKVTCTVCQAKDYPSLENHKIHPVLKVLVCKECFLFYHTDEFTKDEDGIDEFCRWCAQGGDLLLCDNCTNVFCKLCLHRNLNYATATKMENADNFVCFVCNPSPIKAQTRICREVFESLRRRDKRFAVKERVKSGKTTESKVPPIPNQNKAKSSGSENQKNISKSKSPSEKRERLLMRINSTNLKEKEEKIIQKKIPKLTIQVPQKPVKNSVEASNKQVGNVDRSDVFNQNISMWVSSFKKMQASLHQLNSKFDSTFKLDKKTTPWSKFSVMKIVQELKKETTTFLGSAAQLHTSVAQLETHLQRITDHESETTVKDSDSDSSANLSTPTKRKHLRKRHDRKLFRQSISPEKLISNKTWQVCQKSLEPNHSHKDNPQVTTDELFEPNNRRKQNQTQSKDTKTTGVEVESDVFESAMEGTSGAEMNDVISSKKNKKVKDIFHVAKETSSSVYHPAEHSKKRSVPFVSASNPKDMGDKSASEDSINSEHFSSSDDQKLPDNIDYNLPPENTLSDNELAYECLMKNLENDSDSIEISDSNPLDEHHNNKKIEVKTESSNGSPEAKPLDDDDDDDVTDIDNDVTTKDSKQQPAKKHPLLNVPYLDNTSSPASSVKRKAQKVSSHDTSKRRKLNMEEALKQEDLSDEDINILKMNSVDTSGLRVVVQDIKNHPELRKHVDELNKGSSTLPPPMDDKDLSSDDTEVESSSVKKEVLSEIDESILDGDYNNDDDELRDSDSNLLDSDSSGNIATKCKTRKNISSSSSSSDTDHELPSFKNNRLWKKHADNESDNDFQEKNLGKNKKRKRVVVISDSDDNIEDQDDNSEKKRAGRRNIRKILDENFLSQETQDAERSEMERRRRMEKEEEVIIIEDSSSPCKPKTTARLILSKDPLVEVDPTLVRVLKPHQLDGVKFLWMNVIESVARAKEGSGDGCILAHCMGLGKTLQVVTFLHTVLNSPFLPNLKTALVLCPVGTVSNWIREIHCWTKSRPLRTYTLCNTSNFLRTLEIKKWNQTGGVMVVSYGLMRTVSSGNVDKLLQNCSNSLLSSHVVVCDEGHIMKNSKTSLSSLIQSVKTRRRIILTGTPLQNNLMEYHCMVSFIKKRLLGNAQEFANRFANPIRNGQHVDSTKADVHLMKKRSHILHKLLKGCVQRKDISCLSNHLEPKHEYVLLVRLTPLQVRLYKAYLEECNTKKQECLFLNFYNLLNVVCHPRVLQLSKNRKDKKVEQENTKNVVVNDENLEEEDEELMEEEDQAGGGGGVTLDSLLKMPVQELKKLIVEKGSSFNGLREKKELVDLAMSLTNPAAKEDTPPPSWFERIMPTQDKLSQSIEHGNKIVLMMEILDQASQVGDKVVLFSQSILCLDFIEEVLRDVTKERERSKSPRPLITFWRWFRNTDYYRIDGTTSAKTRRSLIDSFNNKRDKRGRLFLISTKAGGIGVNLVGANRAIVFDACWNPTHDMQSIFRIYRFGQDKPCYVYRFIAQGTMEEKIYDRQVVKQSLANRVIDEKQIERHFSAEDIMELYNFTPDKLDKDSQDKIKNKRPPKDELLLRILQKPKTRDAIVSYHEHDSLLGHVVEEELSEAEQRLAWDEYDRERKSEIPSNNPLLEMSLENLRKLRKLGEEELKRNTELLNKCRDEDPHVTMLKLRLCNRNMTYEELSDTTSRISLRRMIMKKQLQETRSHIVMRLQQVDICLKKKTIPISSTSGFNNNGPQHRFNGSGVRHLSSPHTRPWLPPQNPFDVPESTFVYPHSSTNYPRFTQGNTQHRFTHTTSGAPRWSSSGTQIPRTQTPYHPSQSAPTGGGRFQPRFR